MAGRGPAPKPDGQRRRTNSPERAWQYAEGSGWQHGKVPAPPDGLTSPALEAWSTWMGAWFAWFWDAADLPALRQLVRLYDQVERNEFHRHAELRMMMDTYGITPKGQQDRRWKPAQSAEPAAVADIADYRKMLGA